jgi:hypothetical protein
MTEINPDSFILNLPAVFVSGPISVYVIVPNVVGGYGSIVVGATSSSQTWYLNSTGDPAMEKTGTQTGSVDIAAGKYVTWFSDQQAQTNVTFPSGTWTIKLKVPSDWSTNCSAEVGDFNQGSNTFIPFNGTAATGTYGNGVITITITTSGIVSQNHYLALKIINNGTADHSVTTDGSSSLTSPTNDPGYPLPAEITAYSVPGETGSANINSGAGTIGVTVPSGTNVTALVTTFTTSAGVSSVKVGIVSQVSGTTPNNFTSNPPPQLYKRK